MNDLEAYARNQRFSGLRSAIITECPEGHLALHSWGGAGTLLYLGTDINALLAAFLSRPQFTYQPTPRPPKIISGINIDDLEIDI